MPSSPPPNATLTTYRNPVLPGWNAHPSVCNVPGKGYFVATSSAALVPAVPVYHSTDLFTWELVGHAIHDTPGGHRGQLYASPGSSDDECAGGSGVASSAVSEVSTAPSSANGSRETTTTTSSSASSAARSRNYDPAAGGYWTPCIRYHGGRWYVVVVHECEDGVPRLLLTSTRDIFDTYSWTTPIVLKARGRDPDLFFDAGRAYLTYSCPWSEDPRVYIQPIDPEKGSALGPASVLYAGAHTGARLLKCAGWYYLIVDSDISDEPGQDVAANADIVATTACTRIFRSRSHPFTGAFTGDEFAACPANPILWNGEHPEVRGCSRLSLVRGERGWTAIFHAIRGQMVDKTSACNPLTLSVFAPLPLGHETYMANALWKDGWPVINGAEPVGVTGDAEGMRWLPEVDEFEDAFLGELSYTWGAWNATLSTATNLSLSPEDSDEDAELVLRQPSVSLDFDTELVSGTAGVMVRVGPHTAKLGVAGTEIVHDVDGERVTFPLQGSAHTLRIAARPGQYELSIDGQGAGGLLRVAFPPATQGATMGLYASSEARFVRAGWKRVD